MFLEVVCCCKTLQQGFCGDPGKIFGKLFKVRTNLDIYKQCL